MLRRFFLFSTLLAAIAAAGCTSFLKPEAIVWTVQGKAFGTVYNVTAHPVALDEQGQAELQAAIDDAIENVDKLMSTWRDDSQLSRFNAHADTTPFTVHPDLRLVTQAALGFASGSGGLYDPTVGPLVNLWGFGWGDQEKRRPSQAEINATLVYVGHELVHVTADGLQKRHPQVQIDLSSIAKGYGVDRVAEVLRAARVPNFMVEIGGEVVVQGTNPRDEPWQLGIEQPSYGAAPGESLTEIVPLMDQALATSGDYRNFFEEDGVTYAHIINPLTGYPFQSEVASASVIAPNCMRADVAATAACAMGRERFLAWVASQPDVDCLLLIRDPEDPQKLTRVRSEGWPVSGAPTGE